MSKGDNLEHGTKRTDHQAGAQVRVRRAVALLAGVTAIGLLGVGCASSSSKAPRDAAQPATQAVAYAKCMRSHGVPDFPDPGGSSAGSNTFLGIALPASINPQSPAFQSANTVCQKVVATGGLAKPPITEQQKLALLASAECMRKHGVSDFPDPTFPNSGGISQSGVDPQSPAFEHAVRACPR